MKDRNYKAQNIDSNVLRFYLPVWLLTSKSDHTYLLREVMLVDSLEHELEEQL